MTMHTHFYGKAFSFFAFFMSTFVSAGAVHAQKDGHPHDGLWRNEYCVNPSVPFIARKTPIEGEVSVLFDITADGNVENIRTVKAVAAKDTIRFGRAFARSVEDTLKRWKYFAYIEDGVEAPRSDVALTFRFVPPDVDVRSMPDSQSCLYSNLPEPPSHATDPDDPFANLAQCTPPGMPAAEDKEKISGRAKLVFNITPKGDVVDEAIADGVEANSFSDAALWSIRQWRYTPFLQAGQPIARNGLVVEFTFGDVTETSGKQSCVNAPFGSRLTISSFDFAEKCELKIDADGVVVPNRACYKK